MTTANLLISSSTDLISGIEDDDIFNSQLLYEISENYDKFPSFKIPKFVGRPDLLGTYLSGSIDNTGYLILVNPGAEYSIREYIKYLSASTIQKLITKITV